MQYAELKIYEYRCTGCSVILRLTVGHSVILFETNLFVYWPSVCAVNIVYGNVHAPVQWVLCRCIPYPLIEETTANCKGYLKEPWPKFLNSYSLLSVVVFSWFVGVTALQNVSLYP